MMLSIFRTFLQKTSTVKNISILFVISHLVLLVMLVYTFPIINAQIGIKAFDLQSFGYSVAMAESIVYNLDAPTRQLYLFPQLTFLDVLYPVLLALFLSSLLFRLQKKESKLGNILLFVPFLAMLFDYSENICILLMISKSIEISEQIVFISSLFTVLKGVLTSIAWGAIIMYSIKWMVVKIKVKKMKQSLTIPTE